MTPSAATGRIVWAEISDPNGIRKLRPAVIVTPTDQIVAGGPLTVVAITSRLSEQLPADHVLLPWHPQRHARTGLNRRCAAVCTWLATISESDINDFAGIVPSAVMTTILEKVAAALPSSPLPPATPGGDESAAPPGPVQED
jgi:mRNA-degrading endonuclease toxin of MazEF toxin-antitoxin module